MKRIKRLSILLPLGILMLFLSMNASALSENLTKPQADPWADQSGWNLFWSDEFNGTSLDTSVWKYDTGNWGWGNGELENYTPDNAAISDVDGNSCLVITAKMKDEKITSARIYTDAKTIPGSLQYGRIEARMKLPSGKGIWPAFWMLGSNMQTGINWPQCGEIDIMEMIGGKGTSEISGSPISDSTSYSTLHYGENYSHKQTISLAHHLASGKYADDFHIWGIEWNENSISWYVDGFKVGSSHLASLNADNQAFNKPFYILLNLAVGGNWPGYPDKTTVYPQSLAVDWVRVYEKKGLYD